MKYITTVNDRELTIEIVDETHILVDGQPHDVDFAAVGSGLIHSLLVGGKSYEVLVDLEDDCWQVIVQGVQYGVKVEDERERRLKAASGGELVARGEIHIKAPMPGLVVAVPVGEGQEVQKGEVLVILESMKMQNELRAPRAGKAARIRVEPGNSVEQKQILLTLI